MASDEKIPEEAHDVNGRRGHVLMFPFMAQGHLIPFVALAKLLEARTSFIITLVNTPLNIRNLRSLLPSKTTIRLAELPFSSADHDLPPQAENTDTMAYPLIVRLFQASETLQPSFDHLVFNISTEDGHPPICIIADTFLGWTTNVANKYGIFHSGFSTCGAYGMAVYTSLWLHLPHSRTDLDEFELPDFPGVWINRSQLSNHLKSADGKDPWSIVLRKQLSLCFDNSGGMLCNAMEEMETKGVQQLRRMMMGRPVWTVGPLLPPSLFDSSSRIEVRAGKELGISPENCVDWLNLHPPGSVLYISFGSQNTISAAQMMQLAIGLEASGKKFIWVVRPPLGMPLMEEFRAEWLPEGFEDRLISKKQGIVVRSWAPQLEILSHRSTAAFLSHCGWNSVLESLSQGVPIIGWPLAGEQLLVFVEQSKCGKPGSRVIKTNKIDENINGRTFFTLYVRQKITNGKCREQLYPLLVYTGWRKWGSKNYRPNCVVRGDGQFPINRTTSLLPTNGVIVVMATDWTRWRTRQVSGPHRF